MTYHMQNPFVSDENGHLLYGYGLGQFNLSSAGPAATFGATSQSASPPPPPPPSAAPAEAAGLIFSGIQRTPMVQSQPPYGVLAYQEIVKPVSMFVQQRPPTGESQPPYGVQAYQPQPPEQPQPYPTMLAPPPPIPYQPQPTPTAVALPPEPYQPAPVPQAIPSVSVTFESCRANNFADPGCQQFRIGPPPQPIPPQLFVPPAPIPQPVPQAPPPSMTNGRRNGLTNGNGNGYRNGIQTKPTVGTVYPQPSCPACINEIPGSGDIYGSYGTSDRVPIFEMPPQQKMPPDIKQTIAPFMPKLLDFLDRNIDCFYDTGGQPLTKAPDLTCAYLWGEMFDEFPQEYHLDLLTFVKPYLKNVYKGPLTPPKPTNGLKPNGLPPGIPSNGAPTYTPPTPPTTTPTTTAPTTTTPTTVAPAPDNTTKYIIIGAVVLGLGIGAYLMLRD